MYGLINSLHHPPRITLNMSYLSWNRFMDIQNENNKFVNRKDYFLDCFNLSINYYKQGLGVVKNLIMSFLLSPLPMCLRVFSIVEFLLTLDSKPRQNLSALLDGSVKPSTTILVTDAWKASPTRLLSS